MILGQVDFPDELLSAQENGELLVFAGAGVSMGPPANLPSFTGLVKTIGHRSGLPWRKHLSFDHYLGQLEKRNVAVHALARQAVTIPGTSHTPLHTDLVRLFKGASRVRVVTTNYDDHFESATFEAYGENLKTYAAPALPYGDDFSGIVHVHGHTDTRDSRLVLTDRDFGRAYSTEGWARRFLVDAFLRYTVLFVGYSHQDPPMVYLARGMPVDRKRVFALTAEAEKTDWKHLDIESVPFPVLEPARPFGALDDGVRKWADLVNARPLEHKERVCRLLSQGPGRLTHEEDAYLQFIFRQKTYLPWFVQFGLTADWLHWTESRGLLSPTFDSLPTDLYERRHGELVTWWFARSAMAHCDAALNVYKRSSLKMPVHLWNAIGQAIHSSKDLDQRTRRIWLIQLCDRWTVDCDIQYLEYALAPLAEAGDFDSVAMILRLLLAPMVHYKDSIRWNLDDPETYPDIVLRSSDRLWTKELFEKHGEALFRSQSAEIAEMAGGFLSRAYSAFVSHYGEENAYDPISMRRSAIEPHEQDQYSDDVELLVEAARDGLCGLRNSNRPLYLAYLKEWQSDPASILKRIAYHAVNTDVNISPEEKLQYVVDNHGLSHSAEHHEVFLLIVQNFQLAGPESQKQILDYNRAETLQTVKNHPNSDPRYFWRSEYDLLNGILNEGGRTRAVSQRFSAIKRRYPEWEPKDHPDFLSYHSAAVSGMKTPFTADDLRKMRISKVLDYLENYKGGVRFHEPSREGLFFSFHTASSQDPKWGIRVGDKALGKKLASSGHILDCLYSGLQQAEDVPWNEVLSFTRAIPFRYLPSRNVLFLLQKRNWFAVSSVTEFSWIEKLCMRVVKRSARMRDQPSEPDNWYSVAINSDCGLAMRLAITFQHVRFQLKAGSPGHLTKPFKAMVELVMSAENVSGNLCRCILLSKIEVLFQLEKVWAEKVLFPLLDWKKGPDTAFPCWQGFLNNGKWMPGYAQRLYRLFMTTFEHLERFDERCRKRFPAFVISMSVETGSKNIRDRLIPAFLYVCSQESRRELTWEVYRHVERADPGKRTHIMKKWVLGYLHDRIHGKPVLFDEKEIEVVCLLSTLAAESFPQAVELLEKSDAQCGGTFQTLLKLGDRGLAQRFPVDVARLLVFMVKASPPSHYILYDKHLNPIAEQLVKDGATIPYLETVVDELAIKQSIEDAENLQQIIMNERLSQEASIQSETAG